MSAKWNLVLHGIFQSLPHDGKLLILTMLAPSHGILQTQWILLIPVYHLVTAMRINSSLLFKGTQQHYQDTANCQYHNSGCSGAHFSGFWGIGEHARPVSIRSHCAKETDSVGTHKDPHTCFWGKETAAFAREISSDNWVGTKSLFRHVLLYRPTNRFFIELWNFPRTGHITTTVKFHFWKCQQFADSRRDDIYWISLRSISPTWTWPWHGKPKPCNGNSVTRQVSLLVLSWRFLSVIFSSVKMVFSHRAAYIISNKKISSLKVVVLHTGAHLNVTLKIIFRLSQRDFP